MGSMASLVTAVLTPWEESLILSIQVYFQIVCRYSMCAAYLFNIILFTFFLKHSALKPTVSTAQTTLCPKWVPGWQIKTSAGVFIPV